MKIVIIGDGKVGHKLCAQLSEEDYDIVLIDQNAGKLKKALNRMDIFCITGDGANVEVQKEADVPHADLVIACASTDELNMLSCLLAKRLGAKHTIARVRNPVYYRQIGLLKDDLHLSMAVNPELAVSHEIARVLLFPDKDRLDKVGTAGFPTMPEHVTWGIDTKGTIRQDLITGLKLNEKQGLPIFIVADTFNRVVFVVQGYTIGLGEQLMKTLHAL